MILAVEFQALNQLTQRADGAICLAVWSMMVCRGHVTVSVKRIHDVLAGGGEPMQEEP